MNIVERNIVWMRNTAFRSGSHNRNLGTGFRVQQKFKDEVILLDTGIGQNMK